ncbi:MAG: ArsI/CadI family heavy metal resistance metalloenzyme [Prochloraceae cyanobacterium]
MSRIQLALNVSNLEESIAFYSKLFGVNPTKRRPGYANFAVVEPPLKLVLMENASSAGTLNHLGVEVNSTDEVQEADQRLRSHGLETKPENQITCCYAVQDKIWVDDPDGAPWEIYTVLQDAATYHQTQTTEKVSVCTTC